jgi:prephenate dehydrogenase
VADPPFFRVGIVGLGLIGGSVALSVRRVWPNATIVGFDRSGKTAEAARGPCVHEIADAVTGLGSCDLILVAIPPSATIEMIPALAALETNAVITDVGSTKRAVMAAAGHAALQRFVGGHPMAGSEKDGLSQARADLFEGRPWMLVAASGDEAARQRVEHFVASLGALPRWMDAEAHDRAVAYVSHLPQILSVALMNSATEATGDDGRSASGRAFAEMTRLAASPADLWQDILRTNADFVTEALDRFVAHLPKAGDLDRGEWVRDVFTRAAAARAEQLRRP